jgi:hypothetical protein
MLDFLNLIHQRPHDAGHILLSLLHARDGNLAALHIHAKPNGQLTLGQPSLRPEGFDF